jgi:hypothetical protein
LAEIKLVATVAAAATAGSAEAETPNSTAMESKRGANALRGASQHVETLDWSGFLAFHLE